MSTTSEPRDDTPRGGTPPASGSGGAAVGGSGGAAASGSGGAAVGGSAVGGFGGPGDVGGPGGPGDHRSSPDAAPDVVGGTGVGEMAGKTVVVTGATSGIGLETAVALAGMGARLVVTGRDADRLERARAEVAARARRDDVESALFDMASLASVRAGAEELLDRFDRIHVLVNNAGLVLTERHETVDGFETTFATNHLGPFLLTTLLLDRLQASAARVVNVASTAHNSARRGLDFSDLQTAHHRYSGMSVYGRTKLANILFTRELARRTAGSGVTANALHPGTVATGFARDGDAHGVLAFGIRLIKPFVRTPAKGAQTSIYLASSPEVAEVSGQYFVNSQLRQPSRAARDDDAARRLWEVSEELVAEAAPAS